MRPLASVPVTSSTDIGGALRLAAALFPDETQKRIVLVSDGNDTTGRGQSEAALAAARGVQIETYDGRRLAADEVIVERLHTPSTARVGEEIEVEVTITLDRAPSRPPCGSSATATQIGRARGHDARARQQHASPSGRRATEAGFHTFRALVEAEHDTFAQNNRGDSNTIVKGDPRILVLAGDEAVAGNLVTALERERQDVTVVVPEAAPDRPDRPRLLRLGRPRGRPRGRAWARTGCWRCRSTRATSGAAW